MTTETIEDAIYAGLLMAAQDQTSRLYGARFERHGMHGQEIAILLPDGTVRYIRITNPQWPEIRRILTDFGE